MFSFPEVSVLKPGVAQFGEVAFVQRGEQYGAMGYPTVSLTAVPPLIGFPFLHAQLY